MDLKDSITCQKQMFTKFESQRGEVARTQMLHIKQTFFGKCGMQFSSCGFILMSSFRYRISINSDKPNTMCKFGLFHRNRNDFP